MTHWRQGGLIVACALAWVGCTIEEESAAGAGGAAGAPTRVDTVLRDHGQVEVRGWTPDHGTAHEVFTTDEASIECRWEEVSGDDDSLEVEVSKGGRQRVSIELKGDVVEAGDERAVDPSSRQVEAEVEGHRFVADDEASCETHLMRLDHDRVSGTVECRGLEAQSLGSAGASAQPQVVGSLSVSFDCAVLRTSRQISAPPVGGSGGTPSTGGGSSGGGRCQGVASSCSGFSGEGGCSEQKGCSWVEECEGSASACYYQQSSGTCYGVSGCYWSSYSDRCSGFASSCSSFSGHLSCIGQPGCRWDDECDGVAASCSSFLSEGSCEDQKGCIWSR